MPMVPGETRCSPLLIKDLRLSLIATLKIRHISSKNCNQPKVFNTQVTMPPRTIENKGKQIEGAWEETWTVEYCGKKETVVFCLMPDGKGGTHFSDRECSK